MGYITKVSLTLTSWLFIGHCWAADGSTIGCDAPAVASVAVALNLYKYKKHISCLKLKEPLPRRWALCGIWLLLWSKYPVIRYVFLITSLYVPSGLQTGTKTCGKSFLACCSVYFFSATHLDVSEENHKSPESATSRRNRVRAVAHLVSYDAQTS